MRILTLSLFLLLSIPSFAQGDPAATEEQYESSYEWRVRQERLFGVYIPNDLGEVFNQLNQLSEASGRENFQRLSEQGAATKPFFGLGRWMSHNWGFYGGSRLTAYLNQLNLYHPDDMTRFLLVMYHRHLNKKPLDPRPVVEGLLNLRREQEQQQVLDRGEIIYEESRTLDSIPGGR
ncbi:DUF6794 domain-containing protein [Lewinella cohaerens]|uniref:DUF6794 domain-containing protein n=1 Tax=Lewinella cohaerens TaxID=70995 RepID=UPI000380C13B|nr:DUF6794 domain-containing protein [Lewinella cohaerens]